MKKLSIAILFISILFGGMMVSVPLQTHAEGLVPCGGYLHDAEGKLISEEPVCTFGYVILLAQNIIEFLIFKLAAPLAALVIAWAGFLYLTSASSPAQREKAKKILKNVVIGFILALAAWLIVKTLLSSLGVESDYLADPPTAKAIDPAVELGDAQSAFHKNFAKSYYQIEHIA